MVVVEKESDQGFVVMDLNHYEMLMEPHIQDSHEKKEDPLDIWDVMPEAKTQSETWDPDNLSEDEMVELEKQYEEFAKRNIKEAIAETQVKQPEEPKSQDAKKDEDFGEEQFYLEPVE